ncbi:unnamed protein product [Caenorhabditis nigoni]
MSSEKLLNEMPVVLSAVMDHLDFRSIMMMRKVCHDFRNLIDEVVPSYSMKNILLTVRPHNVQLILEDSKTDARYEKIYALQNIWNDLNIILKHQKGVAKSFFVGSDNQEDKEACEKAHSEFLNQFQNNLIARKYPLKVANMRFSNMHQHEIMSILPYINSEKLERISIYHPQESERPMLKLDELIETKQWKNAKELHILLCYVVEPIEKFAHFERCKISVKTISLEFLRHLIEILLNHQSLQSFTLRGESRYESEELKRWFEILFDGVFVERTWYKRIPGSEDNCLIMTHRYERRELHFLCAKL